jgi:hypothetical protein
VLVLIAIARGWADLDGDNPLALGYPALVGMAVVFFALLYTSMELNRPAVARA